MHLDRKNKKKSVEASYGFVYTNPKRTIAFLLVRIAPNTSTIPTSKLYFSSGMVVALLEEDGINKAMIVLDSQEPFP